MSPRRRIRVVGEDAPPRESVVEVLGSAGFHDVEFDDVVTSSDETEPPSVLVLTGEEVPLLCGRVRETPSLADVPIVCVVPAIPPDAADGALAAGADEVVVAPPSPAVFGNRIRGLLRQASTRRRGLELESTQEALLQIQNLMAAGGDAPETLREVLWVAQGTIGFERASLVAHIEASEHAYVVAATDDPSLSQFTLSVSEYPELAEAMRTGKPLLVEDVFEHPVTSRVAPALAARGVRSIAVFPVVWRRRSLGALLFRRSEPGTAHQSDNWIAFGNMLSSMVAAHLRDGSIIERLRDQTRRISRASYEAERRLRTIDSLKEHFEASADGVVVLDDEGRILFVNGTAEGITGFAGDGLIGSALVDLVPPHQREPLQEVIRGVLAGTNIQAFDLNLSTTAGQPICVSVTTSTVLSRSGAVILNFRDVTEQRFLEAELHQTKDFLEKLIDSTVDAIIAADMKGRVLLFNPGAERIYGYRAEEVVGRIPVWKLYPDGVARQVIRMLRSTSYGGVGKLEQTRREVLTKKRELVPVNMTASIIYEEGREVATVGIFSDLRERIRMEQRLLQAQEKIEMQERLAMVAQLAGAAAHELNQPLTSIMAYTQLIVRQSEEDAPYRRALDVMLKEAERMAEIVKKIGRITRYETKEYVGSERIVDLDRSAASSGELRCADTIIAGHASEEEDDFEEPTRQFDPEEIGLRAAEAAEGTAELEEGETRPRLFEEDERTTPSVKIGVLQVPPERARGEGNPRGEDEGDYEELEIVDSERGAGEGDGDESDDEQTSSGEQRLV